MIHSFLHWVETGSGYQFWSGFGSDFAELVGPLAILAGLYRHHNCHREGCKRLGHRHPEHGWPACREHWTDIPSHLQGGPNGSE